MNTYFERSGLTHDSRAFTGRRPDAKRSHVPTAISLTKSWTLPWARAPRLAWQRGIAAVRVTPVVARHCAPRRGSLGRGLQRGHVQSVERVEKRFCAVAFDGDRGAALAQTR